MIEVTHLREGKKEDFISPIIKTQSVFRTAQLNSAMNGANIHDSHEAAGTRDDNEAKKKQLISFVGLTRAMIMAQMLEAGIDLENVDDQVQLTQFRRKGMSEKKTESKRTSLYNIGVLGIAKSTTGLKASDKHTKKKGRKRRRKRSKSDYKSLLTKAEMQRGTPRHSSFQTKKDVNEVKRVGDKKNIHRGLNIVRELRQTVDKEGTDGIRI